MRTLRGPALVAVLAGLAAACDGAEQTRAVLEARRDEWAQQMSELRNRAGDLERAYAALRPQLAREARAAARLRRWRLEASIAGSRQRLADMETNLAQSVSEVEAAIGRDGGEGREALAGLIGRMDLYIREQDEALAANEEALSRIGEDALGSPPAAER